jgi:hypothetical protein
MIENNKLEGMWTEELDPYLRHYASTWEELRKAIKLQASHVSPKSRTRHLPNGSLRAPSKANMFDPVW